jgi:hypothetical protein
MRPLRRIRVDGILKSALSFQAPGKEVVGTKDIGALRIEVDGFMQMNRKVITEVFPEFEVPEPWTSTGYRPVFT